MLKKGYLAGNTVYVSVKHTQKVIDEYFELLHPIAEVIADIIGVVVISNDGKGLVEIFIADEVFDFFLKRNKINGKK